jgi:Glucosidase II beta subunit-like protein
LLVVLFVFSRYIASDLQFVSPLKMMRFVQISLLAISAISFPLSDDSNYVVSLHDEFDESLIDASYDLVEMRAIDETFSCYVPKSELGLQNSSDDSISMEVDENAENIKAIKTRLAVLCESNPCIRRSQGYWTYEVCPTSIRQFRALEGSDGAQIHIGNLNSTLDEIVTMPTGDVLFQRQFTSGAEDRSAKLVYVCEPKEMTASLQIELISVQEFVPREYTIYVGVRDTVMCEKLPSIHKMLKLVNNTGSCFQHLDGWWTYEVCIGDRISQYHAVAAAANNNNPAGTGGTGTASPSAGVIREAESILGVYNWKFGNQIDLGDVNTPGAVVTSYVDGTPCPVKAGSPARTSVIRFECAPSMGSSEQGAGNSPSHMIALKSIVEHETCSYIVTFATSLVCPHPVLRDALPSSLQMKPQPPPETIHCFKTNS